MEISVIIISYQSEKFLDVCLASLVKSLGNKEFEIIVVNNYIVSLQGHDFTRLHPNIHILDSATNNGFAKACNTGTKLAQGKYLLFLNPDTEILSSNIDELFSVLELGNVGISAPELVLPNGAPQPWSFGSSLTFLNLLRNNIGFSEHKKKDVDWVSGAALAIPKKIFSDHEGFDENFFMYFEDIDLCKRVKQSGYDILRLPKIFIRHIGGQSYQSALTQKKHYYRSQDYYFAKHFGVLISSTVKILRIIPAFFSKS